MKKIVLLLTAAVLLFSLQSCEELTIDFEDVVIEEILNISSLMPKSASVDTEQETLTFSESMTFGLGDADDGDNAEESLANYMESLSSVMVKAMAFRITNVPAGKTLIVDSLTVNISVGGVEVYSEGFSQISPETTIDATGLNTEVIDAISAALLNNEELTLAASGEVTGDAQSFDILTRIVSDIEANALDAVSSLL